MIEIVSGDNLPNTLENFLQKYYQPLFAIFLAFNQATENTNPIIPEHVPSLPIILVFTIVMLIRKRMRMKWKQ